MSSVWLIADVKIFFLNVVAFDSVFRLSFVDIAYFIVVSIILVPPEFVFFDELCTKSLVRPWFFFEYHLGFWEVKGFCVVCAVVFRIVGIEFSVILTVVDFVLKKSRV